MIKKISKKHTKKKRPLLPIIAAAGIVTTGLILLSTPFLAHVKADDEKKPTVAVAAATTATATIAKPVTTPLHHISAKVCGECHEDIYDQWKKSMHAQSTALTDPIHGTFYKKVIGDPHKEGVLTKKGKYPVCLKCHTPNMARDKKTKIDSHIAYEEGVNCVSCHSLQSYKGTTNTVV